MVRRLACLVAHGRLLTLTLTLTPTLTLTRFGASLNSSRTYASHALAYIVASLEQIVRDEPVAGVDPNPPPQQPTRPIGDPNRDTEPAAQQAADAWRRRRPSEAPPMLALFAHDFNLLYLRQLLRLHWITPSYDFDAATPGSFLSFELHRIAALRNHTGADADGEGSLALTSTLTVAALRYRTGVARAQLPPNPHPQPSPLTLNPHPHPKP